MGESDVEMSLNPLSKSDSSDRLWVPPSVEDSYCFTAKTLYYPVKYCTEVLTDTDHENTVKDCMKFSCQQPLRLLSQVDSHKEKLLHDVFEISPCSFTCRTSSIDHPIRLKEIYWRST